MNETIGKCEMGSPCPNEAIRYVEDNDMVVFAVCQFHFNLALEMGLTESI